MSGDVRLVHLADLHLGYTGPATLIFQENEPRPGRYVREVDIEEATRRLVKQIRQLQPPTDVVMIAGDVFHRATPLPRAVYEAARAVHRLIQSGIRVVVVDGNHDHSPARLHAGSPLDVLRELGAHVVNGPHYEVIGAGDKPWTDSRLDGLLAAHVLPYEAVLRGEFAGVFPIPERINVLIAHGRVGGAPDLPETNTLGLRAAEIPSDVLRRGWDYVALGDWHVHRTKPLADVPAYFAGSLEALSFGEAAAFPVRKDDPRQIGGALSVLLAPGQATQVVSLVNTARRPVYKLKPIDATHLDAAGLIDQLRVRLDASFPPEALVRLEVQHCSRTAWEGLDQSELGRLRGRVRRCEINWDWTEDVDERLEIEAAPVEEQWNGFLTGKISNDDERVILTTLGRKRIEAAREEIQRRHISEIADAAE